MTRASLIEKLAISATDFYMAFQTGGLSVIRVRWTIGRPARINDTLLEECPERNKSM
jgi:hypothetical protein